MVSGTARCGERGPCRGVKPGGIPHLLIAAITNNRGAPLLRTPRTLPRVLGPGEVETVLGALNTARDRATIVAMLLDGLRRCEVLGLRLGDLSPPASVGSSSARAKAVTNV